MPQDIKAAKDAYKDVKALWQHNHKRMLEDLRFSNPADPQQWPDEAINARRNRVCLTMDRTNQYIVQVVNGARINKPSLNVMPVDSRADIGAANAFDGVIRHIEYRSRAQIAYDWSIEGAARCGIGWMRVIPRVIDDEANLQEICIDRVADHLSIIIDGEQPDGSDALNGFAESLIPKKRFQKDYPKADLTNWDGDGSEGWMEGDQIRICEWQYVTDEESNQIVIAGPDGGELTLGEDDYWDLATRLGFKPEVVRTFTATRRIVKWVKFNGTEVLESTELPGRYIGMVPVIGFESFIGGERYLCGMTRRLIDSQRAYNYERSAMVEAVALQPKAPAILPIESVEGHELHWDSLNSGQPAYLPYNALDTEGRPLPAPTRLSPPIFPTAFAQGGQIAIGDMEAAGGMYQANLGMPNNATSGKQERERKEQGSVATYHFADNQTRSIEHMGRIIVGMIPAIYDTRRQAKILGLDGQQSEVIMDPKLPQAVAKKGTKVIAINPSIGTYDVRVKTGPSYVTQRQEAADGITDVLQAAPAYAPVLAPTLVKLRDWPEAEKVSRMLMAMAPAEVRAIANEGTEDDEEQQIPPQARQMLMQLQEQGQQMAAMLDAAEKELQRLEAENQAMKADKSIEGFKVQSDAAISAREVDVRAYDAQTKRLALARDAAAALPQPGAAPAEEVESEAPEAPPPAPQTIIQLPAPNEQLTGVLASFAELQARSQDILQQIATIVAAPRVVSLQTDASGMPVGAVAVPQTGAA